MNHITRWATALVAALGLTFVSGATSSVEPPAARAQVQVQQKGRNEKIAALKKAIPLLKTPLVEAIALVEKETNGKVYAAELVIDKQDMPQIEVGYLSSEGVLSTGLVNPETKKVSVNKPRKKDQGEDG